MPSIEGDWVPADEFSLSPLSFFLPKMAMIARALERDDGGRRRRGEDEDYLRWLPSQRAKVRPGKRWETRGMDEEDSVVGKGLRSDKEAKRNVGGKMMMMTVVTIRNALFVVATKVVVERME